MALEFYERGESAMNMGQYEQAVLAFTNAIALCHKPSFFTSRATALCRLAQLVSAMMLTTFSQLLWLC